MKVKPNEYYLVMIQSLLGHFVQLCGNGGKPLASQDRDSHRTNNEHVQFGSNTVDGVDPPHSVFKFKARTMFLTKMTTS